jgi:hypothetical protein
MRSYHVADKRSYSLSWSEFPSSNAYVTENIKAYSAAWAAGQEILNWYNAHTESFWMLLVYDTPNREGSGNIPLRYEIEKRHVFFESFSYNVTRRGTLHDHWDISMSLVEV